MCWRAFYPWTVLVWQLIWFVFVLSSSFRMMEAASGTGTHRIRSRPPSLQQRQQQQHGNRQFRDWQDVYIAGFFALSDHEIESALGQGVMPAISLALRHLANSTYLHDYRLRLLHNDTQCSAAVGMKAFFDMMDQQPRKVMILGGSCTSVTDSIAKTSKHWRIPVLSYADTHPMFTKKGYPNFFRIVPSENAFNAPRVKILQAFNWTRVGTLYQNEPRFALAHNGLLSLMDGAGIVVGESQGFVDDLTQPLDKLIEKDVRIILASFNATWGRRVFCEVARKNLYGSRYQWILAGPRQERWWHEEDSTVNCTTYEILTALEGAFVVDVLPLTSSKDVTVSGLTAQEYEAQYDFARGDTYSQFHGYAYDAIWTVAATIKSVVHKLHERNKLLSGNSGRSSSIQQRPATGGTGSSSSTRSSQQHWTLNDFIYRDPGWEKLFLDALRSVNINGVTGRIRFDDNERSGRLTVKQIVGAHEVPVAEYESASDTLFLNESAISWMSETGPPRDRTIRIVEVSRTSIPVFVTLTSVAALGIVLASSFLAVNLRFRNQRYIKMSSPYLNNMIIIGCLLTYTSVILLGLDSHLTSEAALPVICTARIWTLMAGFTLAFGSMFSKTWRVHSIFTDVKLNKKAIKDYQLFMVVGVLLSIDIVILSTWQIIDPFYLKTKRLDPYMHPSQDNVEIQPENEFCLSNHMTIFVGAIYAYKGLLMAFGCFLAWETRNVNIPALNDSKYIGMSVYNVVIMCVIGGAVSFILADEQDVSYVIISIFIIFCTTGTLCLVFVPKMIELKRNPEGTIEKRGRPTVKPQLPKYGGSGGGKKSSGSQQNRETNSLHHKSKQRNTKLRKELRNLDDQIQKLLEQLGEDNDSLAKDGPSFSFKIDSDCRVPSVSGADTISLSSLISSPEPTSTSPHHAKENGGKTMRLTSSHQQQANSNLLQMPSSAPPSASSASGGSSTGVSGNGSDSTAQAMWTAISNPLMLISHVLSKSMEIPTDGSATAVSVLEEPVGISASPGPTCEFVSIEQHPEPNSTLRWIDSDSPDGDDRQSTTTSPVTSLKKEVVEEAGLNSKLSRTSSAKVYSRCPCNNPLTNSNAMMTESLSLTEVRVAPKMWLEPHQRSYSVQVMMSGAGGGQSGKTCAVVEHSRSDSSFNYESNVSELMDGKALVNYFEYRSLESLESATTDGSLTEEANSIQVNFDECSTTFNSPRDDWEGEVNQLYAAVDDAVSVAQESHHPPLPAGDPSGSLNHDQRTLNGAVEAEVVTTIPHQSETPPSSTSTTVVRQTVKSSSRKNKSHSTRTRGRRNRKSKPDVRSSQGLMGESGRHQQQEHVAILPIFKQLIVQKQLESTAQSQPLNSKSNDGSRDDIQRPRSKEFEDRQLASCPNLSIKCDVVEYF